ncbi:MAG: hypothetical protein AB8H86_22220 [Polyangiales bacterium]
MPSLAFLPCAASTGGREFAFMFAAAAATIASLLFVAVAGAYFMGFNKDKAARQLLVTTPWASIGDAPAGVDIRLSGRLALLGDRSLHTPMRRRTCAAWRLLIEKEYTDGETTNWQQVADESESTDFLLIDDTGRARIEGSELTLIADFDAGDTRSFREIPEELRALLDERGVGSQWWSTHHNFRYQESALVVGELVTVAGCGRWENDPGQTSGYRGMGKLLRLGPLKSGRLIAADSPSLMPDHVRSI